MSRVMVLLGLVGWLAMMIAKYWWVALLLLLVVWVLVAGKKK